MKILIICYCYPPDLGPRAFRWSAIAEHWAGEGHEVHVVSGRKMDAPRQENLNGVSVHRVGGGFTESLRMWIEARKTRQTEMGGKELSQESLGGQEFSSAAGVVKRIHDLTWKKVYWPDSACLWFFPALRKSKQVLREGGFDAVISTSTPYTGHLVGHAAKKRFPNHHWMVDIGDPFSFYESSMPWNNFALYGNLNRWSEKRVLEDADSISVTVKSCLDEYARLFPGIEAKSKVIPPILTHEPRKDRGRKNQNGPGKRLVYAGALYRDIRNPTYLLNILEGLFLQRPEDEVHFFGRINDCMPCFEPFHERLGKNIFLHGPVPRERALAELEAADLLINIGNDTTYQLPSKIVDYVATGRPILNIVTNEADSSSDFLKIYPSALNMFDLAHDPGPNDIEQLVAFVASPPDISTTEIGKLTKRFRCNSLASDYIKMIALAPN